MSKEIKFFTFYWLNGERDFLKGTDVAEAFNTKYSAKALKAVDWYDTGLSDTHYWDATKHAWIKRTECEYSTIGTVQEITEALIRNHCVNFLFPNNDKLCVQKKFNHYAVIGWVECFEVIYLEHNYGTYAGESGDEENSHHYMVSGGQYISPDNIEEAVRIFMTRASAEYPGTPIETSAVRSLEEIAESQPQYRI